MALRWRWARTYARPLSPGSPFSTLRSALSTLADGVGVTDRVASVAPAQVADIHSAAAPTAEPAHVPTPAPAQGAAAVETEVALGALSALLAPTRQPAHRAATLHRDMYTSPAVFKLEEEKVFERSWFCVGHASQIPQHGDTFPTKVGQQPIFVTRTREGAVRAFYNVCRHRGSKLVKQAGRYPVISCPYHRWGYSLDGRLLATPLWDNEEKAAMDAKTRAAFEVQAAADLRKEDLGLFPARVAQWGGLLFVNLSGDAPPLEESLGDLVHDQRGYPHDQLVVWRSAIFDVKANWKLLMENFLEYYHLPSVHPDLCHVSGVAEHARAQGRGLYCGFKTDPLSEGGTALDASRLPPLPGLDAAGSNRALHTGIFPNVFYSAYPHSTMCIRMEPKGPERTVEHAELYVHPDHASDSEVRAGLEGIWDFFMQINTEDVEAVVQVQEGMGARPYTHGRYSFKFEEPLHRFNLMIANAIEGHGRIPDGDPEHVPEPRDSAGPV